MLHYLYLQICIMKELLIDVVDNMKVIMKYEINNIPEIYSLEINGDKSELIKEFRHVIINNDVDYSSISFELIEK